METDIAAFLTRRPYYAEVHVREIAQQCKRDEIPFHVECADWHSITGECSED